GAGALDDERFDDVHLTLAATDTTALAPLLAPAGIEAGAVRVQLSGPWAAPAAEISADLVNLRVADASVAAGALRGSLVPGDGGRMEVEAEATFIGVRAGGMDVDAVLGAPPRLRLAARFEPQENTATVDRIELSAPALNASGSGAYDLGSGEGTVSLRATLPDVAAFSSLSGLDLAGSAAVAMDAGLTAAGLDAALGVGSSAFRSGIAAADVLLGPAPSLRAALRADRGGGQVRLDDVVLAGQGMLATATGTLEDGLVNADYRLEVPDVAPAAAASHVAASGALAVDGTVSGPAGNPNATTVLALMDGQLADVIISPVRAELTADSLVTQPRGRLVATAFAAGEPLRLAAPFAWDGGALRIGPIEGAGAGARLSSDVTLPRGGGPLLGAITLRAGGEGRPVALAGHRLDGDAEVAVVLGETNGEQTVAIDGSGRSLALATPEGPLGSVDSLSLRARLAGTDDPRGDVSLAIVGPTVGGLSLHGVDARLSGSAKDASYNVTARLADDPAEVVRTGGAFAQENGRSRITLAFLDGQAGGHRLALRRPLTITQGGGETVIDGLEL
ncbi:MAG TPA: hypothetical protein VES39_12300, partial [Rhodospirillales bacterium]|nr:hypothetical protein [Rhodospirillales bacterium]